MDSVEWNGGLDWTGLEWNGMEWNAQIIAHAQILKLQKLVLGLLLMLLMSLIESV